MKLWVGAVAAGVAAFVTVLGINLASNEPETGPATGRTSQESQRLNDAYLNYVRMNNPELESEPSNNLLQIGYKVCGQLHAFSETTLVNMVEIQYTGAGQRIYDGATQYICEEGR